MYLDELCAKVDERIEYHLKFENAESDDGEFDDEMLWCRH